MPMEESQVLITGVDMGGGGGFCCPKPKQLDRSWAPKKAGKEEVGKKAEDGSSGHWTSRPFLLASFYYLFLPTGRAGLTLLTFVFLMEKLRGR